MRLASDAPSESVAVATVGTRKALDRNVASSHSTQGQVDASPRILAQRRLIQSLGMNGRNHPVMRVAQREIKPGVLNVAGEEHRESDKRRDAEKAFQQEKCPGEYWNEHAFRTTFKGNNVSGDPGMLMALGAIFHVDEIGLGTVPVPREIVRHTEKWLTTMETAVAWGNREAELGMVSEPAQGKTIGTLLPALRTQWEVLRDLLTAAATTSENAGEVRERIKRFNKQLNLCKARVQKHGKWESHDAASAAISAGRSIKMHDAAQQESGQKVGIWKIGESHVRDIQDLERDYNLVTRTEFNSQYDEWAKGGSVSSSSSTKSDSNKTTEGGGSSEVPVASSSIGVSASSASSGSSGSDSTGGQKLQEETQ
jgi:hypothetical protein